MANPRTPVAKAKVTGAAALHPGRHEGRKEPRTGGLPQAPSHLTDPQKKAWALFAFELPWLSGSDAALLEIASIVRGDLLSGEIPNVTTLSMYQSILSKMGATPADRSKVSAPDDQPEEDEFFGAN